MALTAKTVQAAKAEGSKARKLYDGRGLFLFVPPNGSRAWRFRYLWEGREKLISLGTYPEIGLKEARERRDEARRKLAHGIDPSAERKAAKVATKSSLEAVAREWYALRSPEWSESTRVRVLGRLERNVFPWLGARPVSKVTAPDLLTVLRRIEARGATDTAHRVAQAVTRVMQYAVLTGRAPANPARELRGALASPRGGHFPAITEPAALGALLRAIDGYQGLHLTRLALQLAPLVFLRPGELRAAEWAEIDLDNATWIIPSSRMKASPQGHVVPLARQALAILRDAEPLSLGRRYVFPGERTRERPMSNNTLNAALRRLGYARTEVTVHGFRATARTLLDEGLEFPPHLIEHQLAHVVRDPLGRSYNRTQHLPARRKMMQRWADYLDELRAT